MSWTQNLATAKARLAALEQAELDLLGGKRVQSVSYDGGSMAYAQGATLTEVRAALQECRAVVARLSGCRRGGAFVPIFGG